MSRIEDPESYEPAGEYEIGQHVRVLQTGKSPLPGQSGWIQAIQCADPCGPYLVRFDNGMSFRYTKTELTLLK